MLLHAKVLSGALLNQNDDLEAVCKLKIDKSESKEATRGLVSANPEWDEEFTLQFSDKEESNLIVRVIRKKLDGDNIKIGKVQIPLNTFEENQEVDQWYELKDEEGQIQGKVQLVLSITEGQLQETDEQKDQLDDILGELDSSNDDLEHINLGVDSNFHQALDNFEENQEEQLNNEENTNDSVNDAQQSAVQEHHEKCLITLSVIEAKEVDTYTAMTVVADLYCKISIKGRKRVARTKVKKNTFAPVWDQSFEFHSEDKSATVFHFQLIDHNEGKENDDILSEIDFPIAQIESGFDQWVNFPSTNNPDQNAKVHLKFEFSPTDVLSDDNDEFNNTIDISSTESSEFLDAEEEEQFPDQQPEPVHEEEEIILEQEPEQPHEIEQPQQPGEDKISISSSSKTSDYQPNENLEEEDINMPGIDQTADDNIEEIEAQIKTITDSPQITQKQLDDLRSLHFKKLFVELIKRDLKESETYEEKKSTIEKERDQKADQYYQKNVISYLSSFDPKNPTFNMENRALLQNAKILEEMKEKSRKPENMSPEKLKRETEKIQNEIIQLENDIKSLREQLGIIEEVEP